jgi:malonate transporter and related proteins
LSAVLLDSLVPILVGMALGYFAGWSREIDGHNATSLNTLVLQYALPAAVFVPTASTPWTTLLAQWRFLLVLTLVMLSLYAVTYGLQRRFFGLSSAEASVQALTIAQPNYAAAGLPLITAVFDPSYGMYVALALTVGSIITSPLTLAVLEAQRLDATAHKTALVALSALGRSFLKPIVLSPVIAVLFSCFAIRIPSFIERSLALIGDVGAGGALFVTGLVLSTQCPSLNANVVSGTLLKNVLQPLLTAGLILLLPLSHDAARAAILLTALPAGFFGVLFGIRYGVESHSAGSTLLISSVLSALTLAVTIVATGHR